MIFFTSTADPNHDEELRDRLRVPDEVVLNFGTNRLEGKRLAILRGTAAERDSYAVMRQLASFVIENSVHSRGGGRVPPLRDFVQDLFYSESPLPLSCGKASSLLRKLSSASMNIDADRIRYIDLFDHRALSPSSVRNGYLLGGHTIVEMYFPEHQKWAVFDLDMGVVPQRDGIPVSMLDLHTTDADRIDFELLGLDELGKVSQSAEKVERFYRSARKIFAIRVDGTHHFLIADEDQVLTFSDHHEQSYGTNRP